MAGGGCSVSVRGCLFVLQGGFGSGPGHLTVNLPLEDGHHIFCLSSCGWFGGLGDLSDKFENWVSRLGGLWGLKSGE